MRTNSNNSLRNLRVSIASILVSGFALFSCEEVEMIPVDEVPSPVEGVNYYRLKQVDFDGTESYHDIMSTQVDENQGANRNARTLAANETSNGSGMWADNSTWNDGSAPSYVNGNGATIVIDDNHSVTAAGNIEFNNSGEITIRQNATLEVISLTANNGSTINVEAGATLIIRGDLVLNNNLGINVDGTLVILGDVNLSGGGSSDIVNNGNVYIADPTPDFGGTAVSGSALKDMDDLATEIPALMSLLPITLAWQEATTLIDGSVHIEFETAEEQNSDYVVIQWSVDAEVWTDIETISSNNKPSYYEFIHR